MKRANSVFAMTLLIIVIYLVGFSRQTDRPGFNKADQKVATEDSAKDNGKKPRDTDVFPKTPVGNQLRDHMMILSMPAESMEEADAKYKQSIAELKKNAAEAIRLLNDAYRKTEARHYFNRWGLVKTMGELGSGSAVQALAGIATTKLPPETDRYQHHFSSQEEEVIIRIRAVESLGILAREGDKNADRALYQLAIQPTNNNSAIQRRAIKAYLKAGQDYDVRANALKSKLSKSLHEIITTSTTRPAEFEQKMEEVKRVKTDSSNLDKIEVRNPKTGAPVPKAN